MAVVSQQRIRLGMIGGGEGAFIGAVHRHAAALDGQTELVCGAFSRDADNNQRTGASLGLAPERVYDSWQQLLEQEAALPAEQRMQLLVIVTPNQLHVPISIAALQAGFHVFSEKPAGVTLSETERLHEVLVASGLLYGLAHTYLGYPMVWQARELVSRGELGVLRKVYVEYPQGWLTDNLEAQQAKQASWRTDPAQAGSSGCMADIGTHAFGLAEFISGQRISKLCAELATHITGRRLDDDGAALFKTDGGASGVLIASQVCAGEENALKIRLYGSKGGLEWQQMEPNTLVLRPHGAPVQLLRAGKGQAGLADEALRRCRLPAGHPEGYLEAMANLYRDFATAIRRAEQGTPAGVPGISAGLRGMAFIETVTQSSTSSEKWLDVPVTA
ncbi:Gfo/Idh/MocA family protein [Rheinheimera aquimaris]|uniref:Gfo/Idh/MocA family protein n=1 Tax=Rheinheimera aquimaris TaxID=412437 RepID=UPI001E47C585|nr:Gfo/Idh/MocA family oxidoreductase [Rheinheimera aquimaris]MCD1597767.1 Gfo/Idh/MocA family oxidoreductase [Rheinheimera aquimaris]